MAISQLKLIHGLIKNIDELSAFASDPQAQSLIKSSHIILLELNRRADVAGNQIHYQEGRSLLIEAASIGSFRNADLKDLERHLAELPAQPALSLGSRVPDECLEKLRQGIWGLLKGSSYPFVKNGPLKALLTRMAAWDTDGYRQKTPIIPHIPESDNPVIVDGPFLERYIQGHCPGYEDASVVHCYPVPGGFSKQTVLFDVKTGRGVEQLAYRGTTKIQVIGTLLVDLAEEFQIVSYAFSHGAAVAEPLWIQSDIGVTGTRFFISRRALGANLGTAIQPHQDISPAVTCSLAEAIAKIHRTPLVPSSDILNKSHIRPPIQGTSLPDAIRARIKHWYQFFKSVNGETYPVMELAFQWLLENISPADDDHPVLVHGDYGLHNILVHEDKVTAALDWEASHVGDRALDLSTILAGTAGKMDRELFMSAYMAAGGKPVSEFRLKYYQVLMSAQLMLCTIDAQRIYQEQAAAGTPYCTLGLGFIHHAASVIMSGIIDASASRVL
jgi:aminoglycoside phosphotransferase (APT) family kinase protein